MSSPSLGNEQAPAPEEPLRISAAVCPGFRQDGIGEEFTGTQEKFLLEGTA